jgi:hypothetical protein
MAAITKLSDGKKFGDLEIYKELSDEFPCFKLWKDRPILMSGIDIFAGGAYYELMGGKKCFAADLSITKHTELCFRKPGSDVRRWNEIRDKHAEEFPYALCMTDLSYRSFATTGYRFLPDTFYKRLKLPVAAVCNKLKQLNDEINEYCRVNTAYSLPAYDVIVGRFPLLRQFKDKKMHTGVEKKILKQISYAVAASSGVYPVHDGLDSFCPTSLDLLGFDSIEESNTVWEDINENPPGGLLNLALYSWHRAVDLSTDIKIDTNDLLIKEAIDDIWRYFN